MSIDSDTFLVPPTSLATNLGHAKQTSASPGHVSKVASGPADVVLVSMPFASPQFPSIGLSLLKAGLNREHVTCRIDYSNLTFTNLIGPKKYAWISTSAPQHLLIGEWIFSHLIFDKFRNKDAHHRALIDLLDYGGIIRTTHSNLQELPMSASKSISQAAAVKERLAEAAMQFETLPQELMQARDAAESYIESYVDSIVSTAPRIIGFTTMFCQVSPSLAVARRLKERMGSKAPLVVFGGPDVEGPMGRTLLRVFSWVDYVCSGEGDEIFPEFVLQHLAGVSNPTVPGMIGKSDIEKSIPERLSANLDDLPIPDYSDFFSQYKSSGICLDGTPWIPIETSRGCWWGERSHCTFCGLNGGTMRYRRKSSARVVSELTQLRHEYGPLLFNAVDNIVSFDLIKTAFPELVRQGIKVNLFFETKANLTRDQMIEMKRAGVYSVQPGIESFSDDILRLMRKGVSGLQNIFLLKTCRELGINATWNWIWGFPGENPTEYDRLMQWIPMLYHLEPPMGAGLIHLDRFSPLYENSQEAGFISVRAARPYGIVWPISEKDLDGIAFYFDYDYKDQRDPGAYTLGLAGELVTWSELWKPPNKPPGLAMKDFGTYISIVDSRSGPKKLERLAGLDAEVYRHASVVRDCNSLTRHFVEQGHRREEIEDSLERLSRLKLMIVDSGKCLGIACDVQVLESVSRGM